MPSINITPQEQAFIEKRFKLTRAFTWVGSGLLALLFGLTLWLWMTTPLFINPKEVALRLEEGTIPQSSIETMAILLPVLTLTCFVLTAIFIFFAFIGFSNERKLIAIIKRQESTREPLETIA